MSAKNVRAFIVEQMNRTNYQHMRVLSGAGQCRCPLCDFSRALTDARREGAVAAYEGAARYVEGAPLYSSSLTDQHAGLARRLRQRAAAEEG